MSGSRGRPKKWCWLPSTYSTQTFNINFIYQTHILHQHYTLINSGRDLQSHKLTLLHKQMSSSCLRVASRFPYNTMTGLKRHGGHRSQHGPELIQRLSLLYTSASQRGPKNWNRRVFEYFAIFHWLNIIQILTALIEALNIFVYQHSTGTSTSVT